MTLLRVAHLVRNEPQLLAQKVFQRAERQRRYVKAIGAVLANIRQGVSRRTDNTDAQLEATLGKTLPLVVLMKRKGLVACGLHVNDVPALLLMIHRKLRARPLVSLVALIKQLLSSHRVSSLKLYVPHDATLWRFIIYDTSSDGTHVSRDGRNAIAGVLYGDLFKQPGVIDLTQRMPGLYRRVNELAVDAVYTWVNHDDRAWKRSFEAAVQYHNKGDATAGSRFHSSDELRYSLRSVNAFLPWVGTIYIVSNCSPPTWLNTNHARLRWISHDEILDRDCLPTFNSHAIEASLHRIPDLSDNFLYFNDDVFALRELSPATFINENGTLRANLETLAVVNSEVDPTAPDYLNAARNGAKLLYERYGYYPTQLHKHAPFSLRRSLLDQLEAEFEQAVKATRRSQFRVASDISVASFLAHHYGFIKREVTYHEYPADLIKSSDVFFPLKMRTLTRVREKPMIVCLNEGGTPSGVWRQHLAAFMAEQFPVPGPWELTHSIRH
jgi:hypothetical protein